MVKGYGEKKDALITASALRSRERFPIEGGWQVDRYNP